MKKILIAAYYFPPCNSMSSNRLQSFAQNFHQFGLLPTIVTRHWDENSSDYTKINKNKVTIEDKIDYTVVRLPFYGKYKRYFSLDNKFSGLNKLLLFFSAALSIFEPGVHSYKEFYKFTDELLKKETFDYLLISSHPLFLIKLGSRLSKKHKIPLIVDIRDLWDNRLLNDKFKYDTKSKFYFSIYESKIKRWLKQAKLITSVSEPLLEVIKRLKPDGNFLEVKNGFEQDVFTEAAARFLPPKDKFVFSLVGTLYVIQDLSILLEGLREFLSDKNLLEIELNFIGTGNVPEVSEILEQNLPSQCTRITRRIPGQEAVRKMCESHVLFYAGWKGFRGMASGKIYEYLASQRNILIAPNDEDIIESFLKETNSGKTADSKEEFVEIMNEWFNEWKKNGKLVYNGDFSKIKKYSRAKQAQILADKILKIH